MLLSQSHEIHLSLSEPENERKLAYKNKKNLRGLLILFCFSTLNLKCLPNLSLPPSVCD